MTVPYIFANQTGPIPLQQLDADFAAISGGTGTSVGYLSASPGAVATSMFAMFENEWTTPFVFGAIGDGSADDTAAVNLALSSSRNVMFPAGAIFLTTGSTLSVAGKLVFGHGGTLKLKTASTSAALTVSGIGCTVIGLDVDCNSVTQSGIVMTANDVAVIECVVSNFTGNSVAAVYGTNNANRLVVQRNRLVSTESTATVTYGVYIEGVTANTSGHKVLDNYVDVAANTAAFGIYVTGQNSPYTYKNSNALIRGNLVNGPLASATAVGITYRGISGSVASNIVNGFTIGISGDISTQSAVTGNRTASQNGAVPIGVEINGSQNSITGNVIACGGVVVNGISMSVNGNTQQYEPSLDANTVTGNTIINPLSKGVYINCTAGTYTKTANGNTITGNTIQFTTAATGRIAVYLQSDVLYTLIQGNNLVGPGSGQSGGTAVYLDSGPVNTSILGNRIQGFERPIRLAGATVYTNVAALANDMSQDCPSGANCMVASIAGSTYGTGTIFVGNALASGQVYDVYAYTSTAPTTLFTIASGSPSGAITAGPGSLYLNNVGGAGTTLYVHENAAVNTTWAAK